MNNSFDTAELRTNDLEDVSGGKAASERYVEAVCIHCGSNGPHLMDSAWSAVCCQCGELINLKGQ